MRLTTGSSLVLFTDATAQRLFLRPGRYRSVELTAAPGTQPQELLRRVESALPQGTGAVTRANSPGSRRTSRPARAAR
ncbi:hypothetical protein [Streptomyces sp. RKAG337]|uniref:hypothetical protein n=1 Tax=Streptomyces sp. RKAG337 TaxID=2893404 RepID=UPI00203411AB|nr:hypothetical protein [Streptomyces sp. RKAG337]MCM2424307.1 hypothetical protein [Streptomyces sp. RKAG337]